MRRRKIYYRNLFKDIKETMKTVEAIQEHTFFKEYLKENNKLKGVDHISKKSDGIPVRYVFRFHLNPILTAVKTMSGCSFHSD